MTGAWIDEKRERVVFSSDRTVYAHHGIVGLSWERGVGWVVSEGYDGSIWHETSVFDPVDNPMTQAELFELADLMISRWGEFRKMVGAKFPEPAQSTSKGIPA